MCAIGTCACSTWTPAPTHPSPPPGGNTISSGAWTGSTGRSWTCGRRSTGRPTPRRWRSTNSTRTPSPPSPSSTWSPPCRPSPGRSIPRPAGPTPPWRRGCTAWGPKAPGRSFNSRPRSISAAWRSRPTAGRSTRRSSTGSRRAWRSCASTPPRGRSPSSWKSKARPGWTFSTAPSSSRPAPPSCGFPSAAAGPTSTRFRPTAERSGPSPPGNGR